MIILVLQPLRWCCVDCVIHHERDVREEQKYMYVAQTSNNRVIPKEWSWWVTSNNNACEPGEQLIVFANGDDESDLVGWSLLLLAATVRSLAHMPLGISDRNISHNCISLFVIVMQTRDIHFRSFAFKIWSSRQKHLKQATVFLI